MITPTIDKNRLHIAYDVHHVGHVRCHTNFIVQICTRLFGFAVKVTVGDKIFHVNKKSYQKFLKANQINTSTLNLDKVLKQMVVEKSDCFAERPYMRQQISAATKRRLTSRFLKALSKSNFAKAAALALKGAHLEQTIYDRGIYGFSHNEMFGTPAGKVIAITKYTPLLLAAIKSKDTLYPLLKRMGITSSGQGLSYNLSYKTRRICKFVDGSPVLFPTTYDKILPYISHRETRQSFIKYTLQNDKVTTAHLEEPPVTKLTEFVDMFADGSSRLPFYTRYDYAN